MFFFLQQEMIKAVTVKRNSKAAGHINQYNMLNGNEMALRVWLWLRLWLHLKETSAHS